MFNLVTLSRNT